MQSSVPQGCQLPNSDEPGKLWLCYFLSVKSTSAAHLPLRNNIVM